jgi:hypothetical protein
MASRRRYRRGSSTGRRVRRAPRRARWSLGRARSSPMRLPIRIGRPGMQSRGARLLAFPFVQPNVHHAAPVLESSRLPAGSPSSAGKGCYGVRSPPPAPARPSSEMRSRRPPGAAHSCAGTSKKPTEKRRQKVNLVKKKSSSGVVRLTRPTKRCCSFDMSSVRPIARPASRSGPQGASRSRTTHHFPTGGRMALASLVSGWSPGFPR